MQSDNRPTRPFPRPPGTPTRALVLGRPVRQHRRDLLTVEDRALGLVMVVAIVVLPGIVGGLVWSAVGGTRWPLAAAAVTFAALLALVLLAAWRIR